MPESEKYTMERRKQRFSIAMQAQRIANEVSKSTVVYNIVTVEAEGVHRVLLYDLGTKRKGVLFFSFDEVEDHHVRAQVLNDGQWTDCPVPPAHVSYTQLDMFELIDMLVEQKVTIALAESRADKASQDYWSMAGNSTAKH